MRTLQNIIMEAESSDDVFALYYDDGTLYQYYYDENEAKSEKEKLEKENTSFKVTLKKEKKTTFEK